MAGTGNGSSPAQHFGKQLRRERLAKGWSIHELSNRTGIAAPHLSRIENGKRPPTENIALACDAAFPDRRGYFLELYEEMRTWAPPGFRDWAEYENKAVRLLDWWPSMVSGLLQVEPYARSYLETYPGTTPDAVAHRLANRMERQRRLFARDVRAWFVVDHTALYRLVGSPAIMAEQMRRLAEVASLPNVTLQVLPAIGHSAMPSGFMVAGSAAYVEHVAGGLVYAEDETVTFLDQLFDTLRAESYRASESVAIFGKAEQVWTGVSRATAPTEGLRA